ncbi:MAG: CotH kinase family protein [Lachnospiraceae bacterium]|nr:CotH kinase family protein [Lachnospiraceae bacterium]
MKKRSIVSIVLILFFFSFGFALLGNFGTGENKSDADNDEFNRDSCVGETSVPEDGMVSKDFVSHLPLVVVDIKDQEIVKALEYNAETDSMWPIDGVDPYVEGNIKVIDNGTKNSPNDNALLDSKMRIKFRGNMSLNFEKKQYKVELIDEDGADKKADILNMGEDNDWILTISMMDKSLIRNYLAYDVAREIDGNTPDAKYCELLFKCGDDYEYKGLYFIAESIKQSPYRVNISEYNPQKGVSSFLLRRDRFDPEALLLDTYATKNQLAYGYIEVKYPNKTKITDKTRKYIEDRINAFEECLYSDNLLKFENYKSFIDMDSFADYFIINEFFGNYDAGNNSTYIYADKDGKLHMGPVWDFDGAYDNYEANYSDVRYMPFANNAWFDRLMLSDEFVKTLNSRYKVYRKDVLSEERINLRINDIVEYLGNAQKRDWSRWKEEYDARILQLSEDENGIVLDRNTDSYEAEIQRVEDYLTLHGDAIEELLNEENDMVKSTSLSKKYAPWMTIFILLFLCSVVIARRGVK